MGAIDTILTIAILAFFGILIYTKMRNQTLVDTANEIKEIFSPRDVIEEIITRPI